MLIRKYLISIEKKGDSRYEQFFAQDEFNESDFIQFGIKGLELSTKEYFELGVKYLERPLSPSELGCTLSHVQALKDFVQSGAKYAYIFEDDVIVKNHFNFLEDLDFLGENFVLSLGGIDLSLCKKVRGRLCGTTYAGLPVLRVHPAFYCHVIYAMGYVVDIQAAKRLIQYHTLPHIADDWVGFLTKNKDVHFYMTNVLSHPEVAALSQINSVLESERIGIARGASRYKFWKFLHGYLTYRLNRSYRKIAMLFNRRYPLN